MILSQGREIWLYSSTFSTLLFLVDTLWKFICVDQGRVYEFWGKVLGSCVLTFPQNSYFIIIFILNYSYSDLVTSIWSGSSNISVRPSKLKHVVGTVASRFIGYEQQDAQEFLRFFLDGLHEDLNRIINKPTYEGKIKNILQWSLTSHTQWLSMKLLYFYLVTGYGMFGYGMLVV